MSSKNKKPPLEQPESDEESSEEEQDSSSDESSDDSDGDISILLTSTGNDNAQLASSSSSSAPTESAPQPGQLPNDLKNASIYDFDFKSLQNKPWRQPGADMSKWFNYDFNEETWTQYCIRQRQLRSQYSQTSGHQSSIQVYNHKNSTSGSSPSSSSQPTRSSQRSVRKRGGDEIESQRKRVRH